jgi:putative methyltransferase (TIGR04325 family)
MIAFIKKIFRKTKYFSGPYKNWEIAQSKSAGYESIEIFEKVKISADKIKKTQRGYERDSIILSDKEYDHNILNILSNFLDKKDKVLNILDFGGSLGSLYFKYRKKINQKFNWSIIEQTKFVDEGIKNFQNDELNFFYNIEEYSAKHKVDIVLLSSSLQYLRNYEDVILKLIDLNPKYIIILKTPFSKRKINEVFIQKPLKHIYKSTYPCWILSYGYFLNIMEKKFVLENKTLTKPEFFQLSYYNLFFKKKNLNK